MASQWVRLKVIVINSSYSFDPLLIHQLNVNTCRYIVSDCDSVDVFFNQQHYTTTPEEAAAASIKAGEFSTIHRCFKIQTVDHFDDQKHHAVFQV